MSPGKRVSLWIMGPLYMAAGIYHFVNPDFYLKIMPPYLPWHLELVYISGVAEILLGLLVLIPQTRRIAAWGLIALLIAIFPANLHMALNPEIDTRLPAFALWLRLPLQGLLIWWAWTFTKQETIEHPTSHVT